METNIRYFPLLAAAFVPSLALADTPPTSAHDCVVIVFDDSGSMGEDFGGQRRLEAAKRGLKVVLQSVPKSTWIGLLALNAGWEYPLGSYDAGRMNAVIDTLDLGSGGTPLARNIKAGADRLMQEREKQFGYGSYQLLVVTDGEETVNHDLIETYPPEVRSRGLTLDVIGIGIGQEHALRKNAHSYRSADNPRELEQAIREVFAERIDTSVTGGEDGFALIAGLDPGVAQAMITSLGKLPNHPIGEQPAPTAASGPPGSTGGGGGGGGGYSPTPPGCGGCVSGGGGAGGLGALLFMGALWTIIALYRRHLARVRVRSDRR